MTARNWKKPTLWLASSHLAAGLIGALLGYWLDQSTSAVSEFTLFSVGSHAHANVALLAYNYGTAEHARVLLSDMPLSEAGDRIHWSDAMLNELRLAILDGEIDPGSAADTHLQAALVACQKMGMRDCSIEKLREAAPRFRPARERWPAATPADNN
jgi:hypothetical protein